MNDPTFVNGLGALASLSIAGLGVALLRRGLRGGPNGERGLLRPEAGSLGRVEGWRVVVLGLTATGLGLAGLLEARWLLFFALAFGFVETLEATMVIAAWRAGDRIRRCRHDGATAMIRQGARGCASEISAGRR
jgi:hypothetical protein